MSAICRSLTAVTSRPRSNPVARELRSTSLCHFASKRTETSRCYSSLGDASFDFIEGNVADGDGDDDATTKTPDLVPLLPDAPLPSNSDGLLHREYFDDDGNFGPLSLLAVGLDAPALSAVAALLEGDLEAKGVVPSYVASAEMLDGDLRSAFETAAALGEELCLFRNAGKALSRSSETVPIASRDSVRRPAVVLCGMSSEEVLSVVSAWAESGCARRHAEVLFCAAVPGNWTGRTLAELAEDIAGDAASVGG